MPDLQDAIEQLYGNEGLTDELMDEAAGVLLRWAEGDITQAVTQFAADEEAFEAHFKRVRKAMKRLNSLIGTRDAIDEAEAQETLAALTEDAQALGYTPNAAALADFWGTQQALSPEEALAQVLAHLSGAGTPPTDAAPTSPPHTLAASDVPLPLPVDAPPVAPAPTSDPTEPAPTPPAEQGLSRMFGWLKSAAESALNENPPPTEGENSHDEKTE